jgi:hypothetical protein
VRSRFRFELLFVLPAVVALVIVMLAINAGVAPQRLWPVACFVAIWTTSGSLLALANRASRRRAFRQRQRPLPVGVRLRKPLLLRAESIAMATAAGGVLGAIAAALGFPSVGAGITLALVLLLSGVTSFGSVGVDGDLTLEEEGLRIHMRSASCLVPWSSMSNVEAVGPDHFLSFTVVVADVDRVVASVVPASAPNRARAIALFGGTQVGRGQLYFLAWTAGVDGKVLLTAIQEHIARRPNRAN